MIGGSTRDGGEEAVGSLPIVVVNHCHPQMPHVCAVRLREFAGALARRGHRIVLLVAGSQNLGASPPPEMVAAELDRHDWSRPYVLACVPREMPLLAGAREGRPPAILGRSLLAAHFALRGGVFADWTAGSRPYWPVLAGTFKPRVVWATFGNTDAWRIARGIARQSRCSWVMDIKDSWEAFIPPVFRGVLARRFSDAAAVTALSKAHADQGERWFRRRPEVIYSGVPLALPADDPQPTDANVFPLVLMGNLYGRADLDALMAGIGSWLGARRREALAGGAAVTYLGAEIPTFRQCVGGLAGGCRIETPGMLPFPAMLAAMRRSRANLFLRNDRVLFHHKIFEMLAADRPIICLPEECDEVKGIVREVGGTLFSCRTADDVREALERIGQGPAGPSGVSRTALERYAWDAQAVVLERVLGRAAGGERS